MREIGSRIGSYTLVESEPVSCVSGICTWVVHEDGDPDTRLALKTFPPIATDDKLAQAAWEALKKFHALGYHDNLVEILKCDVESDGTPWIVMKYDPTSTAKLISEGPASTESVRTMLVAVAKGLQRIHSQKPELLSRNIQPSNILLHSDGNYKIIEYGLADLGTAEDLNYQPYLAPEGTNTPQKDLYALGHVAYHMALGEKEYRTEFKNALEPVANPTGGPDWGGWHGSETPARRLDEIDPGFSDVRLAQAIADLMVKNPAERCKSATALLKAVDDTAGGGGIYIPPPPRQKIRWRMIGAVAAAVVVLTTIIAVIAHRPPAQITLNSGGSFESNAKLVPISGVVRNMPAGARLEYVLPGPDSEAQSVTVGPDGAFSADHEFGKPGETDMLVRIVLDRQVLAQQSGHMRRLPPKEVSVQVHITPAKPNAQVVIVAGGSSLPARTDARGVATIAVPYGKFTLSVAADGFEPVASREDSTGLGPVKMIAVELQDAAAPFHAEVQPGQETKVIMQSADGVQTSLSLDSTGSANVKLAVGTYTIFATHKDYLPIQRVVDVLPREGANVKIALEPAPAPLPPIGPIDIRAALKLLPKSLSESTVDGAGTMRLVGQIISEAEFKTLEAKLKANGVKAIDRTGLQINARFIRDQVWALISKRAAPRTEVKLLGGPGAEYLMIQFNTSANMTADQARSDAMEYLVDRTDLRVEEFPAATPAVPRK